MTFGEVVDGIGRVIDVAGFLSFVLEVELTGRWPWQRLPDGAVEERAG
jgi:hypothetical protein